MKRASLREEVAAFIRESIFSGNFKPGEKIDQNEIARILGVSRLPVREALIALEGAALVEIVPRHGAFVVQLTRSDLRDHYRIYAVVSAMAAERAATAMKPEQIPDLHANIHDMRTATSADDLSKLNYEFHRIVNRTGATGRLLALVRGLSGGTVGEFFSPESPSTATSIAQHAEIVEAIERRDARAASQRMEAHIIDGGAHAIELLEKRGFWR